VDLLVHLELQVVDLLVHQEPQVPKEHQGLQEVDLLGPQELVQLKELQELVQLKEHREHQEVDLLGPQEPQVVGHQELKGLLDQLDYQVINIQLYLITICQ
jgi:hypothetical protein